MSRVLCQALLGVVLAIGSAAGAWAAFDTYEFAKPEAQAQYQRLTEQLRCPKCQNQNIADSNAPIAVDLRREVHRMVQEGKDDEQIVTFMKERYGDFVTYRPRFDTSTFFLWFGPLIVGLIGLAVILGLVLSSRRAKRLPAGHEIDRAKLNQLLNDQEK